MSRNIFDLLMNIKSSNRYIVDLSLISVDGLTITTTFVGSDEGISSLRASVLASVGEKLVGQWGIGNLNEIIISIQDYIYIVTPITETILIELVCLASGDVRDILLTTVKQLDKQELERIDDFNKSNFSINL